MEKIPARHGAPWDSLENNVTDINMSSVHSMLFLNDFALRQKLQWCYL